MVARHRPKVHRPCKPSREGRIEFTISASLTLFRNLKFYYSTCLKETCTYLKEVNDPLALSRFTSTGAPSATLLFLFHPKCVILARSSWLRTHACSSEVWELLDRSLNPLLLKSQLLQSVTDPRLTQRQTHLGLFTGNLEKMPEIPQYKLAHLYLE